MITRGRAPKPRHNLCSGIHTVQKTDLSKPWSVTEKLQRGVRNAWQGEPTKSAES